MYVDNHMSMGMTYKHQLVHWKEGKWMAATVGWPLLCWALVATNAQLDAELLIRKLKKDLIVEKAMCLSTTLLALGQAD